MSQDLLSVLTGGQQSLAPSPAPTPQGAQPGSAPAFSSDQDAVIRTVYGEADPAGRQAVAAVIRNRANSAGIPLSAVVTQPGQFEAWSDPKARARMEALSPDSPEYQAIAKEVAPVLAGQVDPTNGADAYYNPTLQKSLGRSAPAWDNGTGQQIGAQLYFKNAYAQGQAATPDNQNLMAILGASGGDQSAQPKATQSQAQSAQSAPDAPRTDNEFVNAKTGGLLNPAQLKTYQQLMKAGVIQPKAGTGLTSAGTMAMPYVQTEKGVVPTGPGVYYVDLDGKLQQTPGKPVSPLEGLGIGAAHGLAVVGRSLVNFGNKISPFSNMTLPSGETLSEHNTNMWNAVQQPYEARYGQNGYATVGDIGGQIAGTAPILGAGGGVLEGAAELPGALGAGAKFLAGSAGQGGSGMANLLLRGGSLAARGAAEGAGAAGLTSAQSNAPLAQQMGEGALGGAVLGTLIPGAVGAASNIGKLGGHLVEPFTESGQNAIVNRLINKVSQGGPTDINAAQLVAGSAPTLAQATQNPGLGALERAARATPNGASLFNAVDQQNAAARNTLLDTLKGDKNTLSILQQQRDEQALPLLSQAMQNAQPTTPVRVIATIDDILHSRSGQRDAVKSALQDVRDKLVSVDKNTGQVNFQTDPDQLYGVRQAINDSLSPLAAGTSSDKRLASNELMQVRDALDNTIEQGAPGFKDYLSQYSQLSKPVNEAAYLQSLNMTDSKGNLTLAKVDGALKRIEQLRNANGVNDAKSISGDTLNNLYALRDDLKRESLGSSPGKFVGSNTFQNLATNAIVDKLGVPLAFGVGTVGHNPVAGIGLAAAKLAYGSKNEEIQNRLISALLNPKDANLNVSNGKLGGDMTVGAGQMNKLLPIVKKVAPAGVITGRNLMLSGAQ